MKKLTSGWLMVKGKNKRKPKKKALCHVKSE